MSLAIPYTLKRFIAQFLMPVPLVIELFVLGWVLSRFTRFKRTGTVLKVLAVCLFFAFGYGWGGAFLYRIERLYPPFDPTPEQCENLRGCDVVVLGQGMATESDLPVRCRNNATFLQRLLEGVRVSRLIPESRILVSMAGEAPLSDKTQFLNEYADVVGVPRERFIILNGARDTTEEARFAVAASRTNTLIIATSATHIPRAVKIFKKACARPIPASCDYARVAPRKWEFTLSALPLPSGHGFEDSQRAAHEWLGSVYESVKP
ncbi:MAG: ElyC/SanA/YdcF family protein [bacterium]